MVLMLAVLLWSISTVITPMLAQSLTLLIACRVVLGLGEGLGENEEETIGADLTTDFEIRS